MERINEIVLFLIAIAAIVCLLKEIDDKRNQLHGASLKFIYGGIAVGALLASFYSQTIYYLLMNSCFLAILINRLITKKV